MSSNLTGFFPLNKYLNKLISSATFADTVIVLIGSGLTSALGFVFIFIIARALGPAQFGVYSTVINFATFIAAVADIGVSQSIIKFVNETEDKDKQRWLGNGLVFVVLSGCLFGLVSGLVYTGFLQSLWKHQENFALPIILIISLVAINTFFLGLFQALNRFLNRTVIDVSFSVFRLLLLIPLISFLGITIQMGFVSIILAYVLANGFALILASLPLSTLQIDWNRSKALVRFGKWLGITNLFSNLYGRLDILMLAWLSSAYIAGIYAAAARFITIFPLVVSSFSSVVAPRFARFTDKKQLAVYVTKTAGMSVLISVLMLGLIPLARPIIITAYSISFDAAVPIFQLLVLSSIPLVLSIPATNAIIYYFHKPHLVTSIVGIQVGGLALLNYGLIPIYQGFGPVYSLLTMNIFGVAVYYVVLLQLLKKH